ncbi:MAG: hypothetical protein KJO31_04870 [Gammaproteobacteria bacterium]|nr:hypothetical protein [Gammaproteobacteria bacterium]
MSLKLPFHCALAALMLNGIACACPAMLQYTKASSHSAAKSHHHAAVDEQGCDTGCDCDDSSAIKSDRSQAGRIDARSAADDGDSSSCCLAPVTSARRTATVHPPPGLRALPARKPATPVSRFERMLD